MPKPPGFFDPRYAGAALAPLLWLSAPACGQSPFATRVLEYLPAPGQFVRNPAFNDPARALGPPSGAGTSPVNVSELDVVTLGGFGGTITLGFDSAIVDDPTNLGGLDFIVFGNAFYVSGDVRAAFAECAVVEVSRDVNANALADDPWFLIPGAGLSVTPSPVVAWWDDDTADPARPPSNPLWIPPGRSGVWSSGGYLLAGPPFDAGPVLRAPAEVLTEPVFGYADKTPTLILGDLDADNVTDLPAASPAVFYTQADDPLEFGITPGAGGGDAFDIAWAVDPVTGAPAGLASIDFVRITTGVNAIWGVFGEASAEIDAVARVVRRARADADLSGTIDADDIFAFLTVWFAELGQSGPGLRADSNGDHAVTADDIFSFLAWWFAGE